MWKLKNFQNAVENSFGNYSEAEILVREATNEEPWGPTTEQMEVLCQLCYDDITYTDILNMTLFQIQHSPESSWKRVYKGLLILDYLVKNGPVRIVNDIRDNIKYVDKTKYFTYFDENNKDKTSTIATRASLIIDLLNDFDSLRIERDKAMRIKQAIGSGNASVGSVGTVPKSNIITSMRKYIVGAEAGEKKKVLFRPRNNMYPRRGDYTDSPTGSPQARMDTYQSPSRTQQSSQMYSSIKKGNEEFGDFVSVGSTKKQLQPQKSDQIAPPVIASSPREEDNLLDIFSSQPSLNSVPQTTTSAPASQGMNIFQDLSTPYQNNPMQQQNMQMQYQNMPMQYQNMPMQYQNMPMQYQNMPMQYQNMPVQNAQMQYSYAQGGQSGGFIGLNTQTGMQEMRTPMYGTSNTSNQLQAPNVYSYGSQQGTQTINPFEVQGQSAQSMQKSPAVGSSKASGTCTFDDLLGNNLNNLMSDSSKKKSAETIKTNNYAQNQSEISFFNNLNRE